MNFTQLKSNFTDETMSDEDFEHNEKEAGLTPGQIAGIVLGSVAFVAIIITFIAYGLYYLKGSVRKLVFTFQCFIFADQKE